ncbi:MAG: DUF5995 family protein [Halobacteriota archaeon]
MAREMYGLLSSKNARAAARTVRPGTPKSTVARPASTGEGVSAAEAESLPPEVLARLSEPFDSVEAAHDGLRNLETLLRDTGDRRAVFLTVYTRVTREVRERIEDGAFSDPEWVAAYLVAFANRYRRALCAYERESPSLPTPWRLAFDAAASGDSLVVQDALLGINAHVTYDLALALCDVAIDPYREDRWADHVAINDVLQRLVDVEQDLLVAHYAPGLASVDESLGRLDEALAFFTLEEGRDFAWRAAVALTDSRWSLTERVVRWTLNAVATGAATAILSPNVSPRVLETLRGLETADD